MVNGRHYCIPLSSPKPKFQNHKSTIDLVRILHPTQKNESGAFKIIGVLNINNMIPIDISLLKKIDLNVKKEDTPSVRHYKELMKDQLSFCRDKQEIIENKANRLYNIVVNFPQKNRNLVRRCCDFKKLEAILNRYIAARSQEKTSGAEYSSTSLPAEAARQQASPRSGFTLSRDAIKKSAEIIRRKEEEKAKDKPQEKKHDRSSDLS